MHGEEGCGCGRHGEQHGQEVQSEGCGCGGHEHHGMRRDNGDCSCGCHQHHGVMGFHRHFTSREEIAARLEEYLKQLQAEAKGVEERLAELKKDTA